MSYTLNYNSVMSAEISTDLLVRAVDSVLKVILVKISTFIKALPDDIAAEISESGIYLTGGGSRLTGMADRIQFETGIVTTCVDDPLRAVILGASKMLGVGITTNVWQH